MSIYDRRFGGPPGASFVDQMRLQPPLPGSGLGAPSGPGSSGTGAGTSPGSVLTPGQGQGGMGSSNLLSNLLGHGHHGGPSQQQQQQHLQGQHPQSQQQHHGLHFPSHSLPHSHSHAHAHSHTHGQQGLPHTSTPGPISGGANPLAGPPLLLNTLTQHLHNPPAPGGGGGPSSGGQGQGQAQAQAQGQGQTHSQGGSGSGGMLFSSGAPGQGPGTGVGSGAGNMGNANTNANGSASPSPSHAGSNVNVAGLVGVVGGNTPAPSGKLLLLPNGAPPPAGSEEEKIYELITELLDPATRESALLELSKKREMYEDLALVLWGGFGVMSSLLLEIVNVYPALSPPSLTAHASNRVCNALALLQCVASHSETRSLFLNAHVPLFLYPFLNTTSKTRPFEYLRLTSLGVIGALVKQNDNSDVINFLLSTEIIPLCLRIMETGSELSKTVAIFIVQKILLDDLGLQYICQTYERFYAVGAVLGNMVTTLVETQAVRLLKHVVRCYLRMSDNPRAREALRACLPEALRDGSFTPLLKGDMVTKRCLSTLLQNLSERAD